MSTKVSVSDDLGLPFISSYQPQVLGLHKGPVINYGEGGLQNGMGGGCVNGVLPLQKEGERKRF